MALFSLTAHERPWGPLELRLTEALREFVDAPPPSGLVPVGQVTTAPAWSRGGIAAVLPWTTV